MQKVKISVFLIVILSMPFSIQAQSLSPAQARIEEMPPLPPGPLILTSIVPEQLSPNYWIDRLPDPDRVIKTPDQLKVFNQEIRAMIPEEVDVLSLQPTRAGSDIREVLETDYSTVSNRLLYDVQNKRVPKSFFETQVKPLIEWENIPNRLTLEWGVATRATSVRALPTTVKVLEDVGDIEFDQLQFTLIKLWTPVAIYHESKDGQWLYVQAPYSRGWVRAKDIAVFSSQKLLKDTLRSGKFLMVTGESISVYGDSAFQEKVYQPAMGTILPLAEKMKPLM